MGVGHTSSQEDVGVCTERDETKARIAVMVHLGKTREQMKPLLSVCHPRMASKHNS